MRDFEKGKTCKKCGAPWKHAWRGWTQPKEQPAPTVAPPPGLPWQKSAFPWSRKWTDKAQNNDSGLTGALRKVYADLSEDQQKVADRWRNLAMS